MLPGYMPIIGFRGPELRYIGTFTSGSDANSYNAGTFDFGVGPCLALCFAQSSGASSIGAVTIGGAATTNYATAGSASLDGVEMAGGSAAVVIPASGGARCHAHMYALRYYQNPVPYDTVVATPTSVTSYNFIISIPAGGVALFGSRHNNSNDTSYTNITVDSQGDIESDTWAAGRYTATVAEAAHSETASWTSSSANTDNIAASWI